MNDMMWMFVEFAFASISLVLTYLFVRAFLKRKRSDLNVLNVAVAVLVLAAKFFTSLFFSEYVVTSSVAILTAFVMGHVFFRGKLNLTIMSAILAAIAGAISELMAVIVITCF